MTGVALINNYNSAASNMGTTVQPPELEELELSLIERNRVTYVAYAAFDFQRVWNTLQAAGAESINIVPNADSDCIDVEVYFRVDPPTRKRRPYAGWQIALSTLCTLGITAAALCPPSHGKNG